MTTVAILVVLIVVLHLAKHGNRNINIALLAKKEIVDMHVHVAGVGAGNSGCHVSDKLRRNWRYKTYLRAFGVSDSDLKSYGDAVVFKKISERLCS